MAAKGGGRPRGFPEVRNKRLKEEAVAFYSRHDVPGAIERLLNEMYGVDPPDVNGYMSEYFHGLAKEPVISSLTARETLDSGGGPAIEVQLFCTVHGLEKPISTACVSLEPHPQEPDPHPATTTSPSKGDKKPRGGRSKAAHLKTQTMEREPDSQSEAEEEAGEPQALGYLHPVESITKHIGPHLKGLSPRQQRDVDEALRSLSRRDEAAPALHPSSLQAASVAVALAGASLLHTSPYTHLLNAFSDDNDRGHRKLAMPIPVVSAIGGGQLGCGKLRFREFCLTPLPGGVFPEQVKILVSVHREVGRVLAEKSPSGQGSLPSSGAYCPALDKPEQALDLLQEAASRAGFQLNTDVGVIIDIGADRLYDQEKGKYEVMAGQWKSSEELINLFSGLLQSYPGVLGYIDPLHHKDTEGWMALQERLGSSCLLVAENTLEGLRLKPRSAQLNTEQQTNSEGSDDLQANEIQSTAESKEEESKDQIDEETGISYLSCSGVPLHSTLSETADRTTHLKGHSYYVMLRAPPNRTMNTLIADLAVALQCRFLRLGAPVGITSAGLLSRLLAIREELVTSGAHEPTKAHMFTCSPLSELVG